MADNEMVPLPQGEFDGEPINVSMRQMEPRTFSRLTTVTKATYVSNDTHAHQVSIGSTRMYETGDQPYERRLTLKKGWQPIETGWVDNPGTIAVVNTCKCGGKDTKNVMLIGMNGIDTPFAEIHPGDGLILHIPEGSKYQLYSDEEGCTVTIHAITR